MLGRSSVCPSRGASALPGAVSRENQRRRAPMAAIELRWKGSWSSSGGSATHVSPRVSATSLP
jgi:hypothetical protein